MPSQRHRLAEHPVIIILGALASLIAIVAFATGKQSMSEFLPAPKATSVRPAPTSDTSLAPPTPQPQQVVSSPTPRGKRAVTPTTLAQFQVTPIAECVKTLEPGATLAEVRTRQFEALQCTIDKYNQTSNGVIDTIGR